MAMWQFAVLSGLPRFFNEKYIYNNALLNFEREIKGLFRFKGISENGRYLYSIEYNLPFV